MDGGLPSMLQTRRMAHGMAHGRSTTGGWGAAERSPRGPRARRECNGSEGVANRIRVATGDGRRRERLADPDTDSDIWVWHMSVVMVAHLRRCTRKQGSLPRVARPLRERDVRGRA